MGLYSKIRKYESDVYVYEFNQRKEEPRFTTSIAKVLEPLSKITTPLKPGEIITAKINATFFDFNSHNEVLGDDSKGWTQVVYPKDTVMKFYDPIGWGDKDPAEATALWSCPASYTLMEDGKINIHNTGAFPHYLERHPRTILGQRQNLNILFIVVDGRRLTSRGMTAMQEAQLCKDLGLWKAVNFDGGGSSELVVGGKVMNRPSDGRERCIGGAICAVKLVQGGS
jgi:hypothetical protein